MSMKSILFMAQHLLKTTLCVGYLMRVLFFCKLGSLYFSQIDIHLEIPPGNLQASRKLRLVNGRTFTQTTFVAQLIEGRSYLNLLSLSFQLVEVICLRGTDKVSFFFVWHFPVVLLKTCAVVPCLKHPHALNIA